MSNSPRLFTTIQAVFRAYDTTKLYRELKLRGALLLREGSTLLTLPGEEVYSRNTGVMNLAVDSGVLGTAYLTNIRFVWHADVSASFNVSIPLIQLRSIATRSSKFGVVLPQERGAEREAVVAALTACAGCDAPTAALPCSPAPAALPCSPALQHPPPASLLPPPAAPHPPPPPHQGGLRHMRARAYRVRRHAPRADGAGRGGRGDARSGGQRAPRRGGRRFADPCARRGGRAARGLGRDAGPELGGVPSSGLR